MPALAKPEIVTEAEYLARADASEVKLEFIDGVIYAMAGGSPDHATICQNLGRAFGSAADARGCRGFSSDLRVKVGSSGDYVYPDSTYVCGKPEFEGGSLLNPTLVIEVLSPSTELYDRKGKMDLYRSIPSVEQILLISSDEARVESHRRHGDLWIYETAHGLDANVGVLGGETSLADIYRFIEFPPKAPLPREIP